MDPSQDWHIRERDVDVRILAASPKSVTIKQGTSAKIVVALQQFLSSYLALLYLVGTAVHVILKSWRKQLDFAGSILQIDRMIHYQPEWWQFITPTSGLGVTPVDFFLIPRSIAFSALNT
jgi:hypothetical protein